jgi:acyl carrier protein
LTPEPNEREAGVLTYDQFATTVAEELDIEVPAGNANIWHRLDSLQLYELICVLEDRYQAELPLALWETFETFMDIFEHCELRQKQRQSPG